jgi:hypothetical protein
MKWNRATERMERAIEALATQDAPLLDRSRVAFREIMPLRKAEFPAAEQTKFEQLCQLGANQATPADAATFSKSLWGLYQAVLRTLAAQP